MFPHCVNEKFRNNSNRAFSPRLQGILVTIVSIPLGRRQCGVITLMARSSHFFLLCRSPRHGIVAVPSRCAAQALRAVRSSLQFPAQAFLSGAYMLSTLGNWPRLPVANLVHFLALLVCGLCHFLLHLRPGAVSGGSTPRLRKRPARVARLIRPLRFLRRGRGAVAAAVAAPLPRGQ